MEAPFRNQTIDLARPFRVTRCMNATEYRPLDQQQCRVRERCPLIFRTNYCTRMRSEDEEPADSEPYPIDSTRGRSMFLPGDAGTITNPFGASA